MLDDELSWIKKTTLLHFLYPLLNTLDVPLLKDLAQVDLLDFILKSILEQWVNTIVLVFIIRLTPIRVVLNLALVID